MTCLDYASGWGKEGDVDPAQAAMQAIQAEEIPFDKPEGCVGWGSQSQMACSGTKVSKTTTTTFKMSDGTQQVVSKTIEREFSY